VRRPLRALSTVLITAGLLLLIDAGLTVTWQEPVSAVYAHFVQNGLDDDLRKLELAQPDAIDLAALRSLENERARLAFLARALRRRSDRGAAVARIRIPKIDLSRAVVNGTDTASLRKGPGFYDDHPFPGAPGTVAIAGHRTTYGAPFRHIDRLRKGDEITIEMPSYGLFTYRVERSRIVEPTQVSVVRRVSFDRLVLSACHPLYSAAKRIVVFARFVSAQPRGPALTR
jgi:sortase A